MLCFAITAACSAGPGSGAAPQAVDADSVQQPPPRAADPEPPHPEDPDEEKVLGPRSLMLAPGVSSASTAKVWESGPAEWLEVASRCEDLLLFEGREAIGGDSTGARSWVYWRSDDALPWEQLTIADTFGEFGWGTPADASLFPPERISVRTEWIEVIRYDSWPVPGPGPEPGDLATGPADGFAVIARTVSPAGFLGAGSVIIGDQIASDHDPRLFLESLELDLQALIGSCG